MRSSFHVNLFAFNKESRTKDIALLAWILIATFCVIQSLITSRFNNYLIFENSSRNLVNQTSLYVAYPNFHFDANHYGPIFSLFFFPFSLLPNALGLFLWNIFNCIILFKAIDTLPIKEKNSIYYLAIPSFVAASLSEQFNPAMGAFIVLSYTLLNKNKGLWSTMLIALGAFIKLYGIVGLAFFFFVKDKKRFVLYLLMWSIIFFLLPMLFSSPTFIIASYKEWLISLINKNASNLAELTLDISIMGFVRSIFQQHTISNGLFITIGILIFGLPYLKFKNYRNKAFQLYILASVLIFTVLFSTGSEDCTYIIAVVGVGIWYVLTEFKKIRNPVAIVIFIASFDFPLLLFPDLSSEHPFLLSMMSVPFFVVWLLIIYEAFTMKPDYGQNELIEDAI